MLASWPTWRVPCDPFTTFVVAELGTVGRVVALILSPVIVFEAIFSSLTAPAARAGPPTDPAPRLAPPTAPLAIFGPVTAPFFSFTLVTEFGFNCLAPTLALPRWPAATAVPPPRTRKRQMVEITFE